MSGGNLSSPQAARRCKVSNSHPLCSGAAVRDSRPRESRRLFLKVVLDFSSCSPTHATDFAEPLQVLHNLLAIHRNFSGHRNHAAAIDSTAATRIPPACSVRTDSRAVAPVVT